MKKFLSRSIIAILFSQLTFYSCLAGIYDPIVTQHYGDTSVTYDKHRIDSVTQHYGDDISVTYESQYED